MTQDFPQSIYELLDAVRERPAMYGITCKSFIALRAFLGGLSFSALPEGTPSIWEFPLWIGVRTDARSTSFPMRRLVEGYSDETAYERWFELLDEYRQCKVNELARVRGSRLRSKSYVRGPDGDHPVPVPDWISLGQYAPSRVFYLEDSSVGVTQKSPQYFFATVSEVVAEANRQWGADLSIWKSCGLLTDD